MRNTLPVIFSENSAWCLQCGRLVGICGCSVYRNILTEEVVKKLWTRLLEKAKEKE